LLKERVIAGKKMLVDVELLEGARPEEELERKRRLGNDLEARANKQSVWR
jgi:hypothetical protein